MLPSKKVEKREKGESKYGCEELVRKTLARSAASGRDRAFGFIRKMARLSNQLFLRFRQRQHDASQGRQVAWKARGISQ